MIRVITKEMMKALDAHMIEEVRIPSAVLMENAAFGLTSAISSLFDTDTRVAVVCGTGNNGGDGFATARQLTAKGFDVSIYLIGIASALQGDAAANAKAAGDVIEILSETQAKENLRSLSECVVIDAIFGIGLTRPIEGLFATVIDLLNNSGAYIIACDIPSGINANNGQVLGTALRAHETVTFQCAKPGLLLYPGREYTGRLTVKEIGTSGSFDLGSTSAAMGGLILPKRSADAHKGTYGKLACVVGSQGLSGAGLMCVLGALRSGAGLTTAGIPASLQQVFSARIPECLTFALGERDGSLDQSCISGLDKLLEGRSALAAGCGLSVGEGTATAVKHMIVNYDIKKVFDADALNILSQDIEMLADKQGEIVLTPHLAEFSRLCGLSKTQIMADPIAAAKDFAAKHGIVLLLKGATTIVTDGDKTVLVLAGTPGMAKAGSGDVLTGVVGGLLCSADALNLTSFDAAVYGAYICGKAGEAAAEKLGEHSMTAMDTLDHIGEIMKDMTQ